MTPAVADTSLNGLLEPGAASINVCFLFKSVIKQLQTKVQNTKVIQIQKGTP